MAIFMKHTSFLAGLATLALSGGCGQEAALVVPDEPAVKGLASPIVLGERDTVYLADYFYLPQTTIDSVDVPGCTCTLDKSRKLIVVDSLPSRTAHLREVRVWADGVVYSIVARLRDEHRIRIEIPDEGYGKVQVKGEFNGWDVSRGELTRSGSTWGVDFSVPRGSYQYCLVVDGKEMLDPTNPARVSNNMGGFNSLLKAGESDKLPPVLTTQKAQGRKLTLLVKNEPEMLIALWENYRVPVRMAGQRDSAVEVEVVIPRSAAAADRSHLRVWAYNSAGVSNDLLVPLHKGKVVRNASQLTRRDMPTQIIYSVMVDRFVNGDSGNDYRLNSPDVLPKVDYFGGDLAGITQKIEEGFFDTLGVNTLWLSPITQNPYTAWGLYPTPRTMFSAYHGYWPVSLTQVDARFGSDAALQNLTGSAHRHHINVLMDYVAHHVHVDHPMIKEHPEWITPLHLPDGSLNTERWDEHRLTTWFDTHLPTLNLSLYEVADPLSDSAVFWMKKFDLDGFRHDASKHVDLLFWRMLTQKLKAEVERPIYQIGETYGSPALIASYVGSGLLSAQFDFNAYDAMVAAFAGNGSMKRLQSVLLQSLDTYGYHNLMGNITGNHDRVRFISYAGGAVRFEEDGKAAGWSREVGVGSSVGYQKLALLHALIFSIPGVPCIYYGDEYGQPGANDPDNRRQMQLDGYAPEEQMLLNKVKKLTSLRRTLLPLTYGDSEFLYADDDALALARTYFGQLVVSAINKGSEPKTLRITLPQGYGGAKLTGNFGVAFTQSESTLTIDLPANSFEVLNN
jgi:glycosidase